MHFTGTKASSHILPLLNTNIVLLAWRLPNLCNESSQRNYLIKLTHYNVTKKKAHDSQIIGAKEKPNHKFDRFSTFLSIYCLKHVRTEALEGHFNLLIITYYLLLITYHLLLITYYLLLITYYLLLITYHITGPRSAVSNVSGNRCESDCRSRGRKFDPGPVPYFRGD